MKDETTVMTTSEQTDVETSAPAQDLSKASDPAAGASGGQPAGPRRYKLYDRFADHVSLRTIDAVILITAVLIVGLLIYGIATGTPA